MSRKNAASEPNPAVGIYPDDILLDIAEFKKRTSGIIVAKDVRTDGKSRGVSAREAGSVRHAMKCLYLRYSIAGWSGA